MKEFEEYLKRIGKSENTALTYCRNIRMYFSWCRDSFGSEPKELYRSNVLEYISYMQHTEFIKSIPSIVRVSILIPSWKPI